MGNELGNMILSLIASSLRLAPVFLISSNLPLSKFPKLVKIVFVLTFSISMNTLTFENVGQREVGFWVTTYAIELIIGLVIAFGVVAAFAAIQAFGRVVDMQIGFGAANVIDPKSKQAESLMGSLIAFVFTLLFFELGVHLELISLLKLTFVLLPIGTRIDNLDVLSIAKYLSEQFFLAMLLVLPLVLSLFSLDLMIGFLSKSMPQANIYFVSLPLKIGIGLFVMSLTSKYFLPVLLKVHSGMLKYWGSLFS